MPAPASASTHDLQRTEFGCRVWRDVELVPRKIFILIRYDGWRSVPCTQRRPTTIRTLNIIIILFFLPVVLQWMGLWRLWAFIASNAACCSHSIIKAIYRCLIWFSTCNLIFIIYFFSLCVACRAYMCAVWLCVGSFDLLVSLILLSVVFFFTTVTRQNAKACYRVESSYFIHRMYARGCVAHVYSRRMKQCRIHSWPATVSSIPIRLRWIMRGGGHSSASKHSSNESEYNKPPRISYIILY